jgi:hypothetical protein
MFGERSRVRLLGRIPFIVVPEGGNLEQEGDGITALLMLSRSPHWSSDQVTYYHNTFITKPRQGGSYILRVTTSFFGGCPQLSSPSS